LLVTCAYTAQPPTLALVDVLSRHPHCKSTSTSHHRNNSNEPPSLHRLAEDEASRDGETERAAGERKVTAVIGSGLGEQ